MTSGRNLGGVLGMSELALLYGQAPTHEARANQYRPTDPQAIASEIRRLRGNGLTPSDIAGALRIGLGQVLEALSVEPPAS
jgi:hypothetical protein